MQPKKNTKKTIICDHIVAILSRIASNLDSNPLEVALFIFEKYLLPQMQKMKWVSTSKGISECLALNIVAEDFCVSTKNI
eukprot:snap_masked-scaffold_8-processed-gene-14.20-mRNA-1 protein AED:1.00 eAED:1.00 QI:0/0/0/0/1/1/2/0/79